MARSIQRTEWTRPPFTSEQRSQRGALVGFRQLDISVRVGSVP